MGRGSLQDLWNPASEENWQSLIPLVTERIYQIGGTGSPGPAGPPGMDGGGFLSLRVTHSSPGSQVMKALPAGSIVEAITLQVIEPFDGPAPTIECGIAADHSAFFAEGEVDLMTVGQYAFPGISRMNVDEQMILTLAVSGTAGDAYLFYKVQGV